jgi:hypothetical protein
MTPPLAISQQAQSAMSGMGPVVASSIVSPDKSDSTPSVYPGLGVFSARPFAVGFYTVRSFYASF